MQQQLWIGQISDLKTALSPFMDEQLRAQVQSFSESRQQTLLVGRALLKFALWHQGWLQLNQPLPKIVYSKLNKPYFEDFPVYFNLSHSHDVIALAIGKQPQGVDVELINQQRSLKEALLCKVLKDKELLFFQKIQHAAQSLYAQPPYTVVALDKVNATAKANRIAEQEESFSINKQAQDKAHTEHSKISTRYKEKNLMLETKTFVDSFTDAKQSKSSVDLSCQGLVVDFRQAALNSMTVDRAHADTSQKNVPLNQDSLDYKSALTVDQAAREFFFMQWTVKECLLKLQGASIFALDCLRFDPMQHQVTYSNSSERCKVDIVNTWFKQTQSYKLSTLCRDLILLKHDFWLTVGTYDRAPQIFVFADHCTIDDQWQPVDRNESSHQCSVEGNKTGDQYFANKNETGEQCSAAAWTLPENINQSLPIEDDLNVPVDTKWALHADTELEKLEAWGTHICSQWHMVNHCAEFEYNICLS